MSYNNVNTRKFSNANAQRAILNPARLAAAQEQKDILNRAEAAAYLNVAPQTLSRYVRRGAVPCRKIERRIIFSRKALERWAGGEEPRADHADGAPIEERVNAETVTKEGAEQ